MKRILVCGGRGFGNLALLEHTLAIVHARRGISLIIEGGALGADRMAREWAIKAGVPFQTYEADWKALGRRAGPIRNALMIVDSQPNAVIAFEGGKGTINMVEQARKAGLPIMFPGKWMELP